MSEPEAGGRLRQQSCCQQCKHANEGKPAGCKRCWARGCALEWCTLGPKRLSPKRRWAVPPFGAGATSHSLVRLKTAWLIQLNTAPTSVYTSAQSRQGRAGGSESGGAVHPGLLSRSRASHGSAQALRAMHATALQCTLGQATLNADPGRLVAALCSHGVLTVLPQSAGPQLTMPTWRSFAALPPSTMRGPPESPEQKP